MQLIMNLTLSREVQKNLDVNTINGYQKLWTVPNFSYLWKKDEEKHFFIYLLYIFLFFLTCLGK